MKSKVKDLEKKIKNAQLDIDTVTDLDSLNKATRTLNSLIVELGVEKNKEENERVDKAIKSKDNPFKRVGGCGINERDREFSDKDIVNMKNSSNAIAKTLEHQEEYKEMVELSSKHGEGGGGYIGLKPRITLTPYPSWLKRITKVLSDNKALKRTRKGLDYESLSVGRIRKPKSKGVKSDSSLIICFDTSGSMFASIRKSNFEADDIHKTFFDAMLSYLPNIAKKNKGETWFVDDLPLGSEIEPNNIVDNNLLTAKKIKKTIRERVSYGGGTGFDGVFDKFKNLVALSNNKGTLVLFTDLVFDFMSNPHLITNSGNIIIVTIETRFNKPHIDEFIKNIANKNVSLILI